MNRKSEKFRNADGNATRVRTATGTWQIAYNGANRPVRFENAETQTVVDCGYDSLGRRYFKKVTVAGVVTLYQHYVYRGYLQIAAVDMTRRAQPVLWLVFWDPSQPTATRPLAIQKDGTWFTYGYDITKNVCELFGPAGYIRTAYAYAPFGAVSESDNGVAQPFQWSSEFYDSELDLVYYNYRHYSPSLGRFLSRDPIEEQGGRNLYAFVGNTPVLFTDEKGESWSSLAPPGLCAYVATKMPNMSLPCCNGEVYDPSRYCCRTVQGEEVLTARSEVKTETILSYIELRGRMGIPGLLKHGWIEGDFIPGKTAGFYPQSGFISFPGVVKSPDPAAKDDLPGWLSQPLSRKIVVYPITITASTCDIDQIKSCLLYEIVMGSRLNYIILVYRDCEIWARNVIKKCTGRSI